MPGKRPATSAQGRRARGDLGPQESSSLVEQLRAEIARLMSRASSSKRAPSSRSIVTDAAIGIAAPSSGLFAAGAGRVGAGALRGGVAPLDLTPVENVAQESQRSTTGSLFSLVTSPGRDTAADAIGATSSLAGGAAPQVISAGIGLRKLRGATTQQEKAILGKTVLATAQGFISAIPIAGAGLSAGLGALAGTYEGKRAVAEAGRVATRAYEGQKNIFKGQVSKGVTQVLHTFGDPVKAVTNVFSGGGRSRTGRRHSNYWKQVYAAAEAKKAADAAAAASKPGGP